MMPTSSSARRRLRRRLANWFFSHRRPRVEATWQMSAALSPTRIVSEAIERHELSADKCVQTSACANNLDSARNSSNFLTDPTNKLEAREYGPGIWAVSFTGEPEPKLVAEVAKQSVNKNKSNKNKYKQRVLAAYPAHELYFNAACGMTRFMGPRGHTED